MYLQDILQPAVVPNANADLVCLMVVREATFYRTDILSGFIIYFIITKYFLLIHLHNVEIFQYLKNKRLSLKFELIVHLN
jgi:hypothetical protein